jgi:hypothetical protein
VGLTKKGSGAGSGLNWVMVLQIAMQIMALILAELQKQNPPASE